MLAAGLNDVRSLAGIETVRVDSMAIYRKLGVDGRVEAVTVALARGLVPAPEGRTDER